MLSRVDTISSVAVEDIFPAGVGDASRQSFARLFADARAADAAEPVAARRSPALRIARNESEIMNILERAGVAIRHASALERADWLWDRVRPAYDRMLATVARNRGVERVINGTDRFRLSAQSRGFIAEKYEPAVWRRVMREVRAGDHVAEVGASMGLYALAFAGRVGAAGHVTAFEPDPESTSALEANIGVNGWQDRITSSQSRGWSKQRASPLRRCARNGVANRNASRGLRRRDHSADDDAGRRDCRPSESM